MSYLIGLLVGFVYCVFVYLVWLAWITCIYDCLVVGFGCGLIWLVRVCGGGEC